MAVEVKLEAVERRSAEDDWRRRVLDAGDINELRIAEASAAAAYWQAFAPLEVRFAKRDANLVPSHWRTFG